MTILFLIFNIKNQKMVTIVIIDKLSTDITLKKYFLVIKTLP